MEPIFSSLRNFIQSHSALARVLQNISWITGERALRLLVGLFITSILARHLGPENFGLLSLGITIVSIMMPFTEIGLQGLVIKSHVEKPEETGLIVGTVFGLRVIGAFISTVLALGVAFFFPTSSSQLLAMVTVLSFCAFCRTSDSFKHIFEARVFVRPVVFAELAASLTANAIRLGAILAGLSVFSFALIQSIEAALAAVFILTAYRQHIGQLSHLRFSLRRAIEFLRLGWPLLLSSIAVVIYMKIDQLMLGAMLGKAEVGIYSLAVRISEIWFFLPGSIVWSTFPILVEAKKENSELYARRLQRLIQGLLTLAIAFASVISLSSELLITFLFGEAFSASAEVLVIHAWGGVFVVLGMVSRYWAINENLQKFDMIRTISGALLNIALNFLWIPKYGVIGVAYATLLSHLCSGLLFDLLIPETRSLFYTKMRSCFVFRS